MTKVSIIIACYNQAQYLADAVESVLDQHYEMSGTEIIVINDGSSDDTKEVASLYPVRLINQENRGLPAARNIGIKESTGNLILPLDADDRLHPDFLNKTVPIINESPQTGVVHVHRQHFGLIQSIKYSPEFSIERLKVKCPLNYCSLYRKEVWESCKGYDERFVLGYEDWDFWFGAAKMGWNFQLVDEVLFYYRKHGYSMSDRAKENHKFLYGMIIDKYPHFF